MFVIAIVNIIVLEASLFLVVYIIMITFVVVTVYMIVLEASLFFVNVQQYVNFGDNHCQCHTNRGIIA